MKYDKNIVIAWFEEHKLFAIPEYRFCDRKWRFDFAFITGHQKVALEVEGGVWTGGRHTRASGFVKDIEKYNAAAQGGWLVLRCVPDDLCTMETLTAIQTAMGVR